MRRGTIALLLTVALSAVGCVDGQRYDTQAAAELLPNGMSGPTDAPKGSCWQKNITPAVFDTVTHQIQANLMNKRCPQYNTRQKPAM